MMQVSFLHFLGDPSAQQPCSPVQAGLGVMGAGVGRWVI
jgi:hypothetical protein